MASLGSPPGGTLTAAQAATDDKVLIVDTNLGNADAANKTITVAELRTLLDRVRVTGALKTPPLAADIGSTWSWINQGTSTATQDTVHGGLVFTRPTEGAFDRLSLLVKTIPAAPFYATIEFDPNVLAANFMAMGIAYRDSASGRFAFFNMAWDGGLKLYWSYYNSATSWNSHNLSVSLPHVVRYMRLYDNNSVIQLEISADGVNFVKAFNTTPSRTAWVASPDQLGFGINPNNALSLNPQMIIHDFRIS